MCKLCKPTTVKLTNAIQLFGCGGSAGRSFHRHKLRFRNIVVSSSQQPGQIAKEIKVLNKCRVQSDATRWLTWLTLVLGFFRIHQLISSQFFAARPNYDLQLLLATQQDLALSLSVALSGSQSIAAALHVCQVTP